MSFPVLTFFFSGKLFFFELFVLALIFYTLLFLIFYLILEKSWLLLRKLLLRLVLLLVAPPRSTGYSWLQDTHRTQRIQLVSSEMRCGRFYTATRAASMNFPGGDMQKEKKRKTHAKEEKSGRRWRARSEKRGAMGCCYTDAEISPRSDSAALAHSHPHQAAVIGSAASAARSRGRRRRLRTHCSKKSHVPKSFSFPPRKSSPFRTRFGLGFGDSCDVDRTSGGQLGCSGRSPFGWGSFLKQSWVHFRDFPCSVNFLFSPFSILSRFWLFFFVSCYPIRLALRWLGAVIIMRRLCLCRGATALIYSFI